MSDWFLSDGNGPAGVVCFPHAGGDPRAYAAWLADLRADATVRVVCQPGRGPRYREPRPATLAELADAAARAVRGLPEDPVVLVGHSLGALVAFEVARRLRDWPPLRHLVASGCAAPSLLPTEYIVWASRLPWEEFVAATAEHEELDPAIVADPDLQELLLPELRADVRAYAEYAYRPQPPLAIGATLVNGGADWRVADGALGPWEREFTAAPDYLWRDGGHFYFTDRPERLVSAVRGALRPTTDHVEVI